MIGKIAKMKDGIAAKIILSLTALSFMSLFGVSGYINTANNNKTVIKVGKNEISQSEFSHDLQQKLAQYRNSGLMEDEDNDALRNELIHNLAQAKINELILENVMNKYNVDFRSNLVREIIFSLPQFLDENGQFNHQLYSWYLNRNSITEEDLIKQIKNDLAKNVLINSQVAYTNTPKVLLKQMQKVLGQRRTFKYIKVENDKANVTRQPTAEELDQYYEDLSEEFVVPEKRDVSVMYMSLDEIEKNIEVSPEEIEAYYKEHIEEYEQPEKRDVLQMVFSGKEEASKVYDRIVSGEDFTKVAEEIGQSIDDVKLGFVSKNDLSDDLADIVFELKMNEVSKPIEISENWQLLQVVGKKDAEKVSRSTANAIIADEIRQEKAYDGSYELISSIEDKVGRGEALEDVAKDFNAAIYKIKGLSESGEVDDISNDIKQLTQNKDIIDMSFSYNEGETGQVIEDDNGLALIRVDNIDIEHQMPREKADKRLKEIWLADEKASITQETADNIEHDMEAGDAINQIASRYGLKIMNTMPINRSENFADFTADEMKSLFMMTPEDFKILKKDDDFVIIQVSNIYDDSASMTQEDKNILIQFLYAEQTREMAEALLKGFGSEFETEVHYNRMGISE